MKYAFIVRLILLAEKYGSINLPIFKDSEGLFGGSEVVFGGEEGEGSVALIEIQRFVFFPTACVINAGSSISFSSGRCRQIPSSRCHRRGVPLTCRIVKLIFEADCNGWLRRPRALFEFVVHLSAICGQEVHDLFLSVEKFERLRHSVLGVEGYFFGFRVFQASSATCTFWMAVSRVKGREGWFLFRGHLI